MLQLPLQAGAKSSETGESRTESTRKPRGRGADQRNESQTAGKRFATKFSRGAGRGRGRGAVPIPTAAAAGGQGLGYSQVIVSVGAALLLPPVDDDDGDGHADDEDSSDDASHDPNDASGGTLR